MRSFLVIATVSTLVIMSLLLSIRSTAALEKEPLFPREQVTIESTNDQKHTFEMEIAKSAEQRERGLMFRRSMPKDSGMMFVFWPPEMVSFWMKNTYIPLDILFVRADGAIVKIVTDTKPLDLSMQSSNENVMAVIELNGGEVASRGIKIGDKVSAKVIDEICKIKTGTK